MAIFGASHLAYLICLPTHPRPFVRLSKFSVFVSTFFCSACVWLPSLMDFWYSVYIGMILDEVTQNSFSNSFEFLAPPFGGVGSLFQGPDTLALLKLVTDLNMPSEGIRPPHSFLRSEHAILSPPEVSLLSGQAILAGVWLGLGGGRWVGKDHSLQVK